MGLTFSIIIPVFNGGPAFEEALAAAAAAAAVTPGDEVLIVADGEGDGSYKLAEKYGARAVKLERNGGPARARNFGVKASKADIIFFVDADVTIRPNALTIIRSVFESDHALAALIGSYDEQPSQPNFLSQFKNLLHHYVHQQSTGEASTFWGACGAVKREVFEQVGGFDERYLLPSIEDIELGYRISSAGHKIRLIKELQVTHLKKWEPYSLVRTEFFQRAVPWTRLIWKQFWWSGKVKGDLNLDVAHRLSLISSNLMVLTTLASVFLPWLLLVTLTLGAFFLFLNRPVLKFFYQKRGISFAARAAFWRWVYDLYSMAGFCYGSSHTAKAALHRIVLFTIAKLDAVALGFAVGSVIGGSLGLATLILLLKGGDNVGPTLALVGQFLPGYTVTWSGALIGLAEGFALGYGFGWLFATVRNFSVRLVMSMEKVSRALSRLRNSRLA